jgi:hypothetical protein
LLRIRTAVISWSATSASTVLTDTILGMLYGVDSPFDGWSV